MREFWTFIGGVAVGILVVTGVFVTEEGYKSCYAEHSDDELDELVDEIDEETDDN
ncbi:hypothetical protein [Pseudodesulfovibrio sp. zrk46]|uniref:hypothetical protein n=1 Tax=Pseudodesulfovibrio sp. zrk46 TaxID=2725288 RepID=UPI001448BD5C|nr:hypothetical protein [Pseudodesulfovibrio sp. zrk46]QJB57394.1 hypothetical protein HFN16_13700 [Pseudodesulfovibrio sp. zrk46]